MTAKVAHAIAGAAARARPFILGMALVSLPARAAVAQNASPPQLVRDLCTNCHGYEGRNDTPVFPQLAGQTAAYIEAQLENFRDHNRADPYAQAYMWGIANGLSDTTIKAVAAYYSAQKPPSGTREDPAEVAAGETIFRQGIPAEGVPPCFACHGADAQGAQTTPRLADQHPEYLIAQLLVFKSGLRANEIMHNNVKKMTDDQIRKIAAYLGSR